MAELGDTIGEVIRRVTGLTQTPSAPPDITDELVLRKQYARKRRLAAMQGRGSTFLTGPRGLGGPPGEIASAFLRAAAEPPAPWPVAPLYHRTLPAPGRPQPPEDFTGIAM